MVPADDDRVPVLYLAPWVHVGGSDKGTIDWFRFLDRDRFGPSLITTQPSPNRRLGEVIPYAEEVWNLPDLLPGSEFARFILTFLHTREIEILHIMNSRLGFELLPDIASLPRRPRVVVQLHVEEPDRSGYVRYVTTRYGTLVDAFSVSSRSLSDGLGAYDVPQAKRRLIRTGVDAQREFSPGRVKPRQGLDRQLTHILFPARLYEQKDPRLMLAVAARLRAAGLQYRLHVVGEGYLASAIEQRIATLGLKEEVIMHGACVEMAPWYRACDLVLLTSEFEGVPYTIYEAMAMATPVVAPDLPGVSELLTPDAGVLIAPRHDPGGYAAAICALAADPSRRRALGAGGRARVSSEFTLERMAEEHGALYDELLATEQSRRSRPPRQARHPSATAAFRGRRPRAAPLVSVIVPCFNHGLYLPDCLDSIARQTYSPVETIVVDDGSSDPGTLETLEWVQRTTEVTLLRMPANRGPSAARNAGIEHARGRYVLPVDADNLLLPGAVRALVEQLRNAGESIGFIFPNCKYFGNRIDYCERPSYNLHALLGSNSCDTSSLFDREVFDKGFRYPEDVLLGDEDWDFALTLAEHGIYGEAARDKTLLMRKHAFTRNDLVEFRSVPFADLLADRHPALFESRPQAAVKATWRPALSVLALDAVAQRADNALGPTVRAAARQTCEDFELVIRTARDIDPTELDGRIRRLPSSLASSRAQALAQGLQSARGRYILAIYGSAAKLLADPTLVEKTLRILQDNRAVHALAFAHAQPALPEFSLLTGDDAQSAPLGAVGWEPLGPGTPPASLEPDGSLPLEALARWFALNSTLQWRQLRRRDRPVIARPSGGPAVAIGGLRHRRSQDARIRAEGQPLLPNLPPGVAERIRRPTAWTPPQSGLLCRFLHVPSNRYFFTSDGVSPAGCTLHHILGSVRRLPLPGTSSVAVCQSTDVSSFVVGQYDGLDAPGLLGFVEQVPLPLLDPLWIARDHDTGQQVLVGGAHDPLAATVENVSQIGYIEPHPIHPRRSPHVEVDYNLLGVIRSVDLRARCHRYGVGHLPEGQLEGELGSLLALPSGDCEPLWIDARGRALTTAWPHHNGRPSFAATLRWSGAPLTWTGFSSAGPKLRATGRRAYDAARILTRPTPIAAPPSQPAGYLLYAATDRTTPLYAAAHPVTGDQLLSTDAAEASRLGYEQCALLGHLVAKGPVTGTLGVTSHAVPWASKFGLGAP